MSKQLQKLLVLICLLISPAFLRADGKVVRPRDYHGSLEESAQEAIILFQQGSEGVSAVEDLILKISVMGNTNHFAWIVPFPTVPETFDESPKLFDELFEYCEQRSARPLAFSGKDAAVTPKTADAKPVEVLRSQVVGSFQVDTVREQEAGTLNKWLTDNKYQRLDGADDVLDFYRRKNYVFTCIRVSDAALTGERPVDLHPLRFHFKTGGRDGIYFPMRLTSLQQAAFDLNLYVFTGSWLNDRLNAFGYLQQGLKLRFRDFDSPTCVADAGKWYADPKQDSYLRDYAASLTETTKLFQKISPRGKFYLTNIQAQDIQPASLRNQRDDLWLFPYYTDAGMVPYDARAEGIAHNAYSHVALTANTPAHAAEDDRVLKDRSMSVAELANTPAHAAEDDRRYGPMKWFALGATAMMLIMVFAWKAFARRPVNEILNMPPDEQMPVE